MARERFVVLGLAHVRSTWFREVGRWSTNAAAPIDFVRCVSAEELQTIIETGRAVSAVMVDSGLPAFDRDVIDRVRRAGAAVIVVDDARVRRDWLGLGVTAVIPSDFDRDDLLHVLEANATPIATVDRMVTTDTMVVESWRGQLVAVTGAGGVGTSTVAMALAQGLAADPRNRGLVALADLALDGDQALLHDAGDIAPGLQELVDAHRNGTPLVHAVHDFFFDVDRGGYALLVGLRQHRDWTVIRPRAFEAALTNVQRAFRFVVADIDGDLEGETETGSIDVEERNLLARLTSMRADVVVVVGTATLTGVRAIARTTKQLRVLGVDASRIVVVVNRAPRSPRLRADISRAIAELIDESTLRNPLFAGDRKQVEQRQRDAAPLPDAYCAPLTRALLHVLGEVSPNITSTNDPVVVAPGSLGAAPRPAGPEGLSA
jgi:MinD-like ATPase involved in chromosome partitioning or flagellar assembly